MNKQFKPGDAVIVDAGLGITKNGNIQRIAETVAYVKHYNGSVVGYKYEMIKPVVMAEQAQKPYGVGLTSELSMIQSIMEKKLTPAELKKREEVATAMERENPGMDMSKKMAIATATAKKVAEDTEQIDEKLTDDAKQKINTALGPKFANNTLRKTSGPARAIIGLAKTNPDNIVKKEKVMAEGRGDTVLKTSASNMDDNHVHIQKLKDAGLHASQGSGASNHIIVPPEHAEKARKILGAHLKEDMHYCAKHVFSERFGEGLVVEGSHAEPTEEGLIEWYDVDFGGTVRRVMTEKVKVMHAEYHMNHKKKMGIPQTGKPSMAKQNEETEINEAAAGHTMEAHGVKGMKNTPWRKSFKSHEHAYDWAEKNDAEIHGTRDLEQAKRGNLSPAMKEEVEFEEGFENLPGKATHLTKVDVRHPEYGIISGSTTLRHLGGNKYQVRAGRAKGKTIALDDKHVQKLSMEEVEQLDELSKGTLASYVKKAVGGDSGENRNNLVNTIRRRTGNAHTSVNSDAERDASIKQANKDDQNFTNRVKGIRKATDRLAKEEVELDEAMISYSDFQSKIKAHQKAGNQIKDDKYDKKKASYTVIDQDGTAKKITHTDSGVSQQHLGSVKRDDDESSETKPTEKRGRGRPAGSKSGARN